MKALNSKTVSELAKCSKATAIEIIYTDFLENKKLYLNRKNYASSTMNWLEKNFDAKFTKGNDAPRGGKIGEFVTFTTNEKFDELASLINKKDEEFIILEKNKKLTQQAKINAMVISDDEKQRFLEQTKDLSNRKAREIAHRFAFKKIGFYSNDAKEKFMNLRK